MEASSHMRKDAMRDGAFFLVLAFALRACHLWIVPGVLDSADAVGYLETARHLAAGDLWDIDPRIPILYPLLGALAHLFVHDYERASSLVSLAASPLLVIPVYALSRALHGRKAARIAALTVALWPWLVGYGSRIGPDALGCTLWFLAIWLLARSVDKGGAWLLAAPLAFFALHVTRAEGTVLMFSAPLGAVILYGGKDNRKLLRLIPFALISAALLGGYALFMKGLIGQATVSYRAGLVAHEFFFSANVPTLFAKTFIKTVFEVYPLMLGPVLLLFMGVGFFHKAQPRTGAANATRDEPAACHHPRTLRLELYVLYFAFVQWLLSLFVLSPEPRYQMSALVALSLFSARGMAIVGEQAAGLPWGRWLRTLPVAALVSSMALGNAVGVAAAYLSDTPPQPQEYKAAGEWMREHLEPGLVFTRKPQVGYYAGMPSTGPALDDALEQAIARAKEAGARYLVVDERYTAKMAPGLAPLLDPANAPPRDLRLLKIFSEYEKARIVIYDIRH